MEVNIVNGIAEIPVGDLKHIQKYLLSRMKTLNKQGKTFSEKIRTKCHQIEQEAANDQEAVEMLIDNLQGELAIAKFINLDLEVVHGSAVKQEAFGAIGTEEVEAVNPADVKSVKADLELRNNL